MSVLPVAPYSARYSPAMRPAQLPVPVQSSRAPTAAPKSRSIGHYVLGKTIGEGTFGKVKVGTHILTGEKVAIKILEKEKIVDVADVERVSREIHILKLIRNPHVIQLYEIIETHRQLYLIMEFASGGELFDHIVESQRLKEHEAIKFLRQIVSGVEVIHRNFVVHRDLKPENLLLDGNKNLKIVDFGLSNTFKPGNLLKTACGSPCYAAPEMIAGKRYVPELCDVWSIGVILFAMVCGHLPFEDQNTAVLYKKILSGEVNYPAFLSPRLLSLLKGMLTTDPNKRFNLEKVKNHDWTLSEAAGRGCRVSRCRGCRDWRDETVWDDEILQQLGKFDFPRELAVKCLQANKHNHLTTTYYLLLSRKIKNTPETSQNTEPSNIAKPLHKTVLALPHPQPLHKPAVLRPAVQTDFQISQCMIIVSPETNKELRELAVSVAKALHTQKCFFRQTSPLALSCQRQTVRFEVELVRQPGNRNIVRFKRTLGNPQIYKQIAAEVLGLISF